MPLIYPDNEDRAKRVEQFITMISVLQSSTFQFVQATEDQTKRQMPIINAILKKKGFKSMEELKQHLMSTLTEEERKEYQEKVDHLRTFDTVTGDILDGTLLMTFIGGVTLKLSTPIIRILDTGALTAALNLFSRGFRAMVRGEAVGIAMMGASWRTFRALQNSANLSQQGSKWTRFATKAAKILAIVGLVLDGLLLIIQAIVGAKQKEALQSAITELCGRRFMAKMTELQTRATNTFVISTTAFLVTYNTLVSVNTAESTIKTVMDSLLQNSVDGLKTDLDKITDQSVWDTCAELDKSLGNGVAWKDDDPKTLAEVQEWVKKQPPMQNIDPGVDAPVNGPDQPANNNTTFMASAVHFAAMSHVQYNGTGKESHHHKSSGSSSVLHIYMTQMIHGAPVENGDVEDVVLKA